MIEDPLRFRKIDILRARGFEDGGFPVEDLSDGVNVVHGPNASGKTTLAKAISSVLWPENGLDHASIVGRFTLDGDDWRVDLQAGRATYQRDGQEASAPRIPSADQSDRYRLALHDLLQHETQNESFAERIMRESAGGYDVPEAADELGFRDRPSGSTLSASTEAADALGGWNDATGEVQELRGEERRLARLKRQLDETKAAKRRLDLIETAIDHAEAQKKLEDAQAHLDALPDVLEDVTGDEMGTLDEIEEDISEWETKKSKAAKKRDDALETIERVDLPDDGLSVELIPTLREDRDRVRELENRIDRLDRDIAEADKRREEEREKIGEEVSEDKLETLDTSAWGDLHDFADEAEQVLADRHAHDELQRVLQPDEEPDGDIDVLRRGRQALEEWLGATTEPPSTEPTNRVIPALVVLAVALASTVLGLLAPTSVFLAGVVLVAGLAAAFLYLQGSDEDARTPGVRESHEDRFEQLGLEDPTAWTPDAVRKRLDEVNQAIADHEVARRRREVWEARTSDLEDLEQRGAEVEERRQELVDRFGVAPDTDPVQLVSLARHVGRWQSANATVKAKHEKRSKAAEQLSQKLVAINEHLASHGYEPAETSSEATAKIRDLKGRKDDLENAERKLENAKGTLEDADRKLTKLRDKRTELFEDLSLEVGEVERLRELCEQRSEYLDRREERNTARSVAGREEERLEEHADFEPHLKDESLTELKETKRELESKAEEHDSLLDDIKDIETKIRNAKEEHEVEDALAEKERALDELADVYARDCERMVGQALAEHVQSETTEANRGDLFDAAQEILATITKGRYRLDLDESGDGSFRAYDTVKERGFGLDELSSATRVQLLMAVRIAFVEQQESTTRLPLLMDETLANTDDPKAQAVIESTIELARDARQVFYFTAQGDEVAKWKQALESNEDVPHAIIDLAERQDDEESLQVPDLGSLRVRAPDPPEPQGCDHAAYGEKLGVPPLDPRRGAGSAHLWYVVEDPDLLHHLLQLGIKRWGQLRTLLETTGAHLVTDDQEILDRLHQNGEALETFVEAWKRGRGKPVDRSVLEDADAVSDKFIDDVTELAETSNGDAEEVIRRLRNKEVDRFWESKMNELEDYFQEHGHIDPVDTLDPEEIRVRVMRTLLREGVERGAAGDQADALLNRITRPPGASEGD